MPKAIDSPYLVPWDGSFRISEAPTAPPEDTANKKTLKRELSEVVKEIAGLQRVLYADDRIALLAVFQAMDAGGKDGTIRAVLSGVNPAGCQVSSFKQPSKRELDHDFLWRTTTRLPQRGRIGVFNRSYYEEVLVVRVHPGILDHQQLPHFDLDTVWQQRCESIRDLERHLERNGTFVVKFWLNVSREQQKERFLARLDQPEKHWKFAASDVKERGYWDRYMEAYEQALNATSREFAPWYAIPADSKPYMRLQVATILRDTLRSLPISYPKVDPEEKKRFDEIRQILESEDD